MIHLFIFIFVAITNAKLNDIKGNVKSFFEAKNIKLDPIIDTIQTHANDKMDEIKKFLEPTKESIKTQIDDKMTDIKKIANDIKSESIDPIYSQVNDKMQNIYDSVRMYLIIFGVIIFVFII